MSAIQSLALSQFETILRKALPGVELPDNLVELMLAAMKDNERDRLNEFSLVKPTIDQINASNLKATVKLLPFMPDRVDYMMDQGRCPAIDYDGGLFLPCCAKCKDGNVYCKKHTEKPTPFGDYAERLEKWNEGLGAGTLCYTVGEKEYNEVFWGEYLMKNQITYETVRQAIKDAHLMIRIPPHDLQTRAKTKKAKGRPSEKKVLSLSLDGGEEEAAEEPVAEKKPTRVKLTPEEKKAKEEAEAAEKAAKKEKREADRKVIAERKAEEEIAKAKLAAEKAAAKAALAAEKAEAKAAGLKARPKAANPVRPASPKNAPPTLGTSLDAEYYPGDLDELTSTVDPETGNNYWYDEERNVYDANKKKVGIVNDEDEMELL
jgi:hypothetical protein